MCIGSNETNLTHVITCMVINCLEIQFPKSDWRHANSGKLTITITELKLN